MYTAYRDCVVYINTMQENVKYNLTGVTAV